MASRAPALLVALTALLYNGIPVALACNMTVQSTQMSAMLALYDHDAPPRPKVEVATKFDVRHATIDEGTETLHVLADFRMYWNDSRLTWNASDTGCTWFLVNVDQLWTPDVDLVNAAATYESAEQLMARVSSTGAVTAVSRVDVALPVAMHLDDWPNDLQTGDFQFASRAHGIDEIVLTDMDLRTRVHESGAWQLMHVEGFLSSLEGLSEGDAERSLHKYRVSMQRRAPAQALAARVVLTSALLLLGAAALLPPASRAPLAATAAFIVALWLCTAVWRLQGAARPPRAICVHGAVCAAAGAAAVAAVLVLRVARLASPPPQLVRNLVLTAGKVIPFSAPADGCAGESGTWAAAARALDTALLGVLALVLFVLLCVYI
ncbi:hypothetical protein O0L34_g1997 [Tuta absoluta]|nr:hypothetical protein O0L34_g1997 [Tuta absoluta]